MQVDMLKSPRDQEIISAYAASTVAAVFTRLKLPHLQAVHCGMTREREAFFPVCSIKSPESLWRELARGKTTKGLRRGIWARHG